jgi:predicted nucleotidyltransferase
MAKQLIELMFGAYRRRLLAQLLLRPDEKFHVRELGRMTGLPAGSIHRELKALSEAGLLLREHLGNQVHYQANPACAIYDELAGIFRKTVGLAGLVRDALAALAGRIDVAFVFGSLATGRHTYSSDVDVMIIGDLALVDVVKALSPVQDELRREINPVVMTAKRFKAQWRKDDRFVKRVMAEARIFVIGDDNELAELVEDRRAG